MRKTIQILIFIFINQIIAQHTYSDLKYIEIDKSHLNGTFGYTDSEEFILINKFCMYDDKCYDYEDPVTFIGYWKLDNATKIEFYYTEAPSDDPTFIAVYNNQIILEEAGNTLHFKGKTLYIEGSANAFFDKKRKFEYSNNRYNETKQPFYYINKEGELNYPITIYETVDFKNKVAYLPKGYKINILLGITGGEYNLLEKILIKSEFGLLGWFNFEEVRFLNEPLIPYFFINGD